MELMFTVPVCKNGLMFPGDVSIRVTKTNLECVT